MMYKYSNPKSDRGSLDVRKMEPTSDVIAARSPISGSNFDDGHMAPYFIDPFLDRPIELSIERSINGSTK